MECVRCDGRAIIDNPSRCKDHFIEEFEQRVHRTIQEHSLVRTGQRIAVACSGGKDSLTVLWLLAKWYEDVTAIAIDEGIEGYREHSLADLRRVCEQIGVSLRISSYKEFTGQTLDEMLARKSLHACTVCGAFRRHLIALASKEFDVLATGHNADDEAQTILMNIIRGNTNVFPRGGPSTGLGNPGFTQRVKPLYFCSEKEVMTYAYLHRLTAKFVQCPNARDGYRWTVRESFNSYLEKNPRARKMLLDNFLIAKQNWPSTQDGLLDCERCGEPSSRTICKACEMLDAIRI